MKGRLNESSLVNAATSASWGSNSSLNHTHTPGGVQPQEWRWGKRAGTLSFLFVVYSPICLCHYRSGLHLKLLVKNSLHLHLAWVPEVEKYVCTAEFGPQGLLLLLIATPSLCVSPVYCHVYWVASGLHLWERKECSLLCDCYQKPRLGWQAQYYAFLILIL